MSPILPQPILVGEVNPYGSDPAMALYPLPAHAAGGRLAAILNMSRSTYLRAFRRVNLCTGAWDARLAAERADSLRRESDRTGAPLILLGRKVAEAFGFGGGAFFTEMMSGRVFLLPHPSGRCRAWNLEGSFERARALVYPLLPPRPEKP